MYVLGVSNIDKGWISLLFGIRWNLLIQRRWFAFCPHGHTRTHEPSIDESFQITWVGTGSQICNILIPYAYLYVTPQCIDLNYQKTYGWHLFSETKNEKSLLFVFFLPCHQSVTILSGLSKRKFCDVFGISVQLLEPGIVTFWLRLLKKRVLACQQFADGEVTSQSFFAVGLL